MSTPWVLQVVGFAVMLTAAMCTQFAPRPFTPGLYICGVGFVIGTVGYIMQFVG